MLFFWEKLSNVLSVKRVESCFVRCAYFKTMQKWPLRLCMWVAAKTRRHDSKQYVTKYPCVLSSYCSVVTALGTTTVSCYSTSYVWICADGNSRNSVLTPRAVCPTGDMDRWWIICTEMMLSLWWLQVTRKKHVSAYYKWETFIDSPKNIKIFHNRNECIQKSDNFS